MKQSQIYLLLALLITTSAVHAQQVTDTPTAQATDCFFCDQDGKPMTIGSNNPPRQITELTVVGKPKEEGLPSAFEPNDLVDIDYNKYLTPKYRADMTPENIARGEIPKLRTEAHSHMVKMLDAAHKSNIDLYIDSAYRSYKIQCEVFSNKLVKQLISHDQLPKMSMYQFKRDVKNGWKPTYTNEQLQTSINEVNTRSALPGQSEHQLGSVADLVTYMPQFEKPEKKFSGYALEQDMEKTPAFKWLQENAYKFGYVLSYPTMPNFAVTAPNPRTGYIYEPWHWRFIGIKRATDYKYCGNRFVLREYLKQVALNPQFACVKAPAATTTSPVKTAVKTQTSPIKKPAAVKAKAVPTKKTADKPKSKTSTLTGFFNKLRGQ